MRFKLTLLFFAVLLSSCATILNNRKTTINVYTNKPTSLIVNTDTLRELSKFKTLVVDRSRKPLSITVKDDSITKIVTLNSRFSLAYSGNWLTPYFLGFLIDWRNPKIRTYQRTVYIPMGEMIPEEERKAFREISNRFPHHFFKFSPLKIFDPINPAIELGFEYKHGLNFSSQVMLGYITELVKYDDNIDKLRGYRVSFEEKYYVNKSVPFGQYFAFEYNILSSKRRDVLRFYDSKMRQNGASNYYNYENVYSDSITIKKTTNNFTIKIGYQYVKKHLVMDAYVGLGVKFKNTKHFGRINEADTLYTNRHFNIYGSGNESGKRIGVNFPINVRIGYAF